MTHLARSGDNLFSSAEAFVRKHSDVVVLCAYITTETLKHLNDSGNIKQVVVRWEFRDICSGASDFEELFQYCRNHEIELFSNQRIHLKVLWDMRSNVFLGSANVSRRGLGETGNSHHWELSTAVSDISFEDQQYLNKLLRDSTLITDARMEELRRRKAEVNYVEPDVPDYPITPNETDRFLITELPAFEFDFLPEDRFENVVQAYLNPDSLDSKQRTDLAHDLALYEIPPGLSGEEFELKLGERFNAHPFIMAFKSMVKNYRSPGRPDRDGTIHHTGVTTWFSANTTTVPRPHRRTLNDDIATLYNWICHFDPEFSQTGRRHEGRGSNILKWVGSVS